MLNNITKYYLSVILKILLMQTNICLQICFVPEELMIRDFRNMLLQLFGTC